MWTECDLSEGEMKKEKKEPEMGSETERRREEHRQKNTCTLGSASLGSIDVTQCET